MVYVMSNILFCNIVWKIQWPNKEYWQSLIRVLIIDLITICSFFFFYTLINFTCFYFFRHLIHVHIHFNIKWKALRLIVAYHIDFRKPHCRNNKRYIKTLCWLFYSTQNLANMKRVVFLDTLNFIRKKKKRKCFCGE